MNWCSWPNTTVDFDEVNCSALKYGKRDCHNVLEIFRCRQTLRIFSMVVCVISGSIFCTVAAYELKNKAKKQATSISRLLLISLFVALLYAIVASLNVNQTWPFDQCIVHSNGLTGMYACCTLVIYTILWKRQRKFYEDPRLRHAETRAVRMLSRCVIAVIYFSIIGVVVGFNFTYCMVKTSGGCIPTWLSNANERRFVLTCVLAFTFTTLVAKLLLLALIVHPLMHGKTQTCMDFFRNIFMVRGDEITRLINRLAISTLCCILSSVLLGLVLYLAAERVLCLAWDVVCGMDLCIVNITMICSLSDGPRRLCPVLLFRKEVPKLAPRTVSTSI